MGQVASEGGGEAEVEGGGEVEASGWVRTAAQMRRAVARRKMRRGEGGRSIGLWCNRSHIRVTLYLGMAIRVRG
jgi:hypothetical protein